MVLQLREKKIAVTVVTNDKILQTFDYSGVKAER